MILLCLFPCAAFAKTGQVFEQTLQKYQKARLVSMKVAKTVKSELLGRETIHRGQIQLANGKFRWENHDPERTILLFDGQQLINVQYPPKEFKGPVQVAKSKVDVKTRKQILVSALLSPGSAKSRFKVLKGKNVGRMIDYELSPAGDDLQIKNLVVRIEPKKKRIQQISYTDDVGNFTKMDFSDIKFLSRVDASIFKFTIPKDAQVINL